MARMIPQQGPKSNESKTAEPTIYYALKKQLSDDFTVIHSLPLLSSAVFSLTGKRAPTVEADFLIFHPDLGILALEVKGGALKFDRDAFVYPNGTRIDPIAQAKKNAFALSKWVEGAGGPKYQVGYAIAFPESSMQGKPIPPALVDKTGLNPQDIWIDRGSLPRIGQRITEIMQYWQRELRPRRLTLQEINKIVDLICPTVDYTLRWKDRIEEDTQRRLILTPEQIQRLEQISQHQRVVLSGRSGTGKTLLAMTHARRLASEGKRVLFLVYNVALLIMVRRELAGTSIQVTNFHQLCRQVASLIKEPVGKNNTWYRERVPQLFHMGVTGNMFPTYDALVIDEAQVFQREWLQDIALWFTEKPLLACCDETQVFHFESRTYEKELAEILQATLSKTLTINMRSPREVFERLQVVIPPAYEMISLRDQDPSTLVEIVSKDPRRELRKIIKQLLNEEGVPASAILVIHDKKPPDVENLLPKKNFVTIARCRGIEAPIVIIFARGMPLDDIMLSCAYSRATSRCIAIYAEKDFLQQDYPYLDILKFRAVLTEKFQPLLQKAKERHKASSSEKSSTLSTPSW